MPHLLHIDSSARTGGSLTRGLTSDYVAAWLARNPGATVTYRDLAEDVPGFVSPAWITGAFGPQESHDEESRAALNASETLIREIEAADVIVLGVPMYNFSVPAVFKAWIDRVLLAGRTFAFNENGPVGLLSGKKAVVLRASGSDFDNPAFAPMDFHGPYLRTVLGFIGITDVEIIAVNGPTAEQTERTLDAAGAAIAASVDMPQAA